MENAYGIGVKNRYELFYDEDVDPFEIIRQQQEEKEKKKSHPKDKTKNPKPGKALAAIGITKNVKESPAVNSPKPSEPTEMGNKSRSRPLTERMSRNTRNFDESKTLEERKNFRNREDHGPLTSENRERDSEMRRGRGGFRGRGRGRARGGFNSFENRPPRREFDRHSGSDRTGFRSYEKKEGAGSNNWADVKIESNSRKKESESTWMDEDFETPGRKQNDSNWNDIDETNMGTLLNKNEDTGEKKDDLLNLNTDSKENLPVNEDHNEEKTKEMTLDEWKREQEAKRVVPKYNLRKPGEGEDGNQWKRVYVLKKKAKAEVAGDEEEDDEEEEEEDDDDLSRRGRQRQLVDIPINFNDSRRGRGRGRGTRGIGPRNERGPAVVKDIPPREERREPVAVPNVGGRNFRGSMKINRSGQQSAPKVDDWNDFPSLVTA